MGQALYRKYRSKSLGEVVGQEHITKTLAQALKQGRISHAYLFTGPRGVGKTSIARIWAHEINGLAYDEGQTHLDIIEIDAASNRRIDEIRDLRDKVYIAPAQAKYKVYIIDEVHMLTKEAFNALLKTLEEPPAHAVFILATTEMHKLPPTIISRTQRYVFKPIEPSAAMAHLRHIADQEKIEIDDAALELMAQHGDGSFRDSISLLDQAAGQGAAVTADTVRLMIGMPPQQAIEALLAKVQQPADIAGLMANLTTLYDQGFQAAAIAKQLAAAIRAQLMSGAGTVSVRITQLLSKLLEVPISHDPERYLEIVLLETLPTTTAQPITTTQAAEPVAEPKPVAKMQPPTAKTAKATPAPTPKAAADAPAPPVATTDTAATKVKAASVAATIGGVLDEASWAQVLNELKKQYNTLYSVARMAQPTFVASDKLELAFSFAFHQKRLSEAKNHQILSDAITHVTGARVEIICIVDAAAKNTAKPTASQPTSEPLSAISNIFGGGELLES